MHTLPNIIQQTWKGEMMKQWKMVMSAVLVAIAANTSFADDTKTNLPKGWELHTSSKGKYELSFANPPGSSYRRFVLRSNSNASDFDFVAITKVVDVSKLQGKAAVLSIFLRGTGPLEHKDVWLRYFGQNGELFSQQTEIFADDDTILKDKLSPSFMKTIVPIGATHMEVGMGMQGPGTLELGRLMFQLVGESQDMPKMVQRDPLVKKLESVGPLSSTDALALALDE